MKRLMVLIAGLVFGLAGVSSAGDLSVTGKVGIGTANPLYDLHISGVGAQYLRLEDTSGSGNFLQLRANSANGAYIGSEQNLSFRTGVGLNNLVLIGPTGNVGIGTANPEEKLTVYNGYMKLVNDNAKPYPMLEIDHYDAGVGGHPVLIFYSLKGTVDNPLPTEAGQELGMVSFRGYDGSIKVHSARIIARATTDFSTKNYATDLSFTAGGTATCCGIERMVIKGDTGNVGIGTATPARVAHINDTMRLEPRSTAPSNPALGDIYVDSDTNELCFYDGSSWTGLKAGGACL